MNLTNELQQNRVIDIWLDCDPGLDDCFAIILAAAHPRLNLIGVSTTSGNTNIENTTRNASDVLNLIGKSHIPVYMGARQPITKGVQTGEDVHGQQGLGGVKLTPSPVSAFTDNSFYLMIQKIMKHENKLTFICTGAMTNLALLLQMNSKLRDRIQLLSFMGGAIGFGNITPAAQFNIYYDAVAAKMVMGSGLKIVMVPLQVTHTSLCTEAIRQKMNLKKSSLHSTLMSMIMSYKEAYFKIQGFLEPPLHDPCAVFYVLEPHQFQIRLANVQIDTYPTSFGRTNCNFRSQGTNVSVCSKMNVDRFWQIMLKAYSDVVPDY